MSEENHEAEDRVVFRMLIPRKNLKVYMIPEGTEVVDEHGVHWQLACDLPAELPKMRRKGAPGPEKGIPPEDDYETLMQMPHRPRLQCGVSLDDILGNGGNGD